MAQQVEGGRGRLRAVGSTHRLLPDTRPLAVIGVGGGCGGQTAGVLPRDELARCASYPSRCPLGSGEGYELAEVSGVDYPEVGWDSGGVRAVAH